MFMSSFLVISLVLQTVLKFVLSASLQVVYSPFNLIMPSSFS